MGKLQILLPYYIDYCPNWTPDGRIILGRYRTTTEEGTIIEIWVINSDGTGESKLRSLPPAMYWWIPSPTISPDGSKLLYKWGSDARYYLANIYADGISLTTDSNLAQQGRITFSPDGRFILYSVRYADADEIGIWRMRSDGTNKELFLRNPDGYVATDLSFSQDAKKVVFVGFNPVGIDIYLWEDTAPLIITNLNPSDNSSININTPTISAMVYDGKYDFVSGVNPDTIEMYLDGKKINHTYTLLGYNYNPYDPSTGLVSYAPSSPLSDGLHTVNLSISDNAGNPASVSWSFTVDTTYPTVSASHTPDTPTTLQEVNFTVIASDNIGIKEVQLYIDNNLVKIWNNAGIFTYTTGPFTESQHTYYTKAKDLAGNEITADIKIFTVIKAEEITSVSLNTSKISYSKSIYTNTGENKHRYT